MDKQIIGIADMKMAQNSGMLITYALGSCIGICLYDQRIKLGALIHIMLPLNLETGRTNPLKYADTGIRETIKKMEAKGVTPDDIQSVDDLHKLPFLTKADLRDAYPYGLLAKPLDDCVRIQSTSGTTGRRVVAFYTQHDIDLWEDCCARAIMAAGGGLGASIGPQLVGVVTDALSGSALGETLSSFFAISPEQIGMKAGLLIGSLFPLFGILVYRRLRKTASASPAQKDS